MAVRQHLYALQSEKFVAVEERPVPIGRPAKHWQLTTEADRFFPDAYSELSVALISALGDTFGAEGLKRVLETRCARQLTAYAERIRSSASLKEKLQQLARVRTEEGYMAEVKPGENKSVSFSLRITVRSVWQPPSARDSAPPSSIFSAKCSGLTLKLQREEHILSGARRCAYRVQPRSRRGRADRTQTMMIRKSEVTPPRNSPFASRPVHCLSKECTAAMMPVFYA